jgi:MFS family permease
MNGAPELVLHKAPLSPGLKFVLTIGVVSFFADFTYEGARGITGPFMGSLGATGAIVRFWPITLLGYFVQLLSVPLLAVAGNWQTAAVLILIERIGKATRNPPRDVMLSHAAKEIGFGWGFGVHEALDQFGALFGPLLVAAVIAYRGNYRLAFAVLLVPALVCLTLLVVARLLYPKPENLEPHTPDVHAKGLPLVFWIYLAGAGLVAAGFPDFQLIAFHFQKAEALKITWIPIMYSIAMAVSGTGSLVFGRMFDRLGIGVLIPLTLLSALFAPLVFLGGFWSVLVGSALWGLGMGVHESIVPAAVATMVPPNRRPSAYGLFTAGYGIAWFLGSAVMGVLYDRSIAAVVIFCVLLQLTAIPLFLKVRRARQA